MVCIHATINAAPGFENSKGWFDTYFIIIRPLRTSDSTYKCMRMEQINLAASTATVGGNEMLKSSPKIVVPTKEIMQIWKPKTKRAERYA